MNHWYNEGLEILKFMRRRKLYKHLIETNYNNISSAIKQFKKRRATKANNK